MRSKSVSHHPLYFPRACTTLTANVSLRLVTSRILSEKVSIF
jgi:hypothetical protein